MSYFLPPGAFRFPPTDRQPVDGRTFVMYHGTTKANAQLIKDKGFRRSPDGMLGPGVYLSRDLQKASSYPIGHPEYDRAVIKVSVKMGKVKRIDRQGHPLQKTWHAHGYDTAWVPPKCGMVPSGLEEDCVWDPKRIRIIKIINPATSTNVSQFLPTGAHRFGPTDRQPVVGRTFTMYHGTTKRNGQLIQASGFHQPSVGMLGRGVSLSRDLQKTSRYPIGHVFPISQPGKSYPHQLSGPSITASLRIQRCLSAGQPPSSSREKRRSQVFGGLPPAGNSSFSEINAGLMDEIEQLWDMH